MALTPPNVSGYRSCRLPSEGIAVVRLIIPGRTGREVAWKAILLFRMQVLSEKLQIYRQFTWMSALSEAYVPHHVHVCGIHHKTEQDNSFPRYADTPRQLFQHPSSASDLSTPYSEHIIRRQWNS